MCGTGPQDGHWHIGVEDPFGSEQPRAVLRIAAGGVATSSLRVHRWQTARGTAHHLIDPRTGAPAESGLRSVTVIDDDPMWAEVWSKVLFVAGAHRIAATAESEARAVCWVDDANRFGATPAGEKYALWVRDVA
jgi:thiamine biosynthesis lipoprotein